MIKEHPLPPPSITVREAADYFGISEDVVRHLLRNRKIAGFKAGGQWRIPRESIAEFLINSMSR